MQQCEPFLRRQVELLQPRLIVVMGRFAAQALLGTDATIASLRGRVHEVQIAGRRIRDDHALGRWLNVPETLVLRDREALSSVPQGDYIFTRAVPPDRLLTWRDLAARPIVRRGQVVEVLAQSGPVSVSLKGMAMQDGARNETIRIRNLQSNREFTAQVTGENRAVIRL